MSLLDLDVSKSISELGLHIRIDYLSSTILTLIDVVKICGKNLGIVYKDIGNIIQYQLSVKYLDHTLPIVFEYDFSYQYINIVYYNKDQTITYLKIFLSINDDPIIKYIHNDKSGAVPSYKELKPGGYLMNFAHCLLSYIGFTRIRLDDDSYLITKDLSGIDIRTKLWLYSLLTKGKSWYAKYGYVPSNTNMSELNMAIADVQNLKLDEISLCLQKILSINDKNLINLSQSIIDLIGSSQETLIEYTVNHTLHDFTILTNYLTQSIFERKITIDNEHVDFYWYVKYKRLLVSNVMQVNNDIQNHYRKLNHVTQ